MMANAKKCDRCSALYETYDTHVNGYLANALSVTHERSIIHCERDTRFVLDLCPRCMHEFAEWLNEPDDLEKE